MCDSVLTITHQTFHVKNFERKKLWINVNLSTHFQVKTEFVVDTGSYINILPLKIYLGNNGKLENLKQSNVQVTGIGNTPISVTGTFTATTYLDNGFVKNIEYHVLDVCIPPLLGLNFFGNYTIISFLIKKDV